MALERELRTYQLLRPELLKKYKGLFVLIQGDQLVNAYDTYADALKVATKQFGTGPFFIHQVLDPEPVATGIR